MFCIEVCSTLTHTQMHNDLYKMPITEHFMAEETIFSKIIRKEISADILYQDDLVTAFRDINPRAPSHILIIPNKLIPTVNDVEESDELALGRMFTVAKKLAKEEGIGHYCFHPNFAECVVKAKKRHITVPIACLLLSACANTKTYIRRSSRGNTLKLPIYLKIMLRAIFWTIWKKAAFIF